MENLSGVGGGGRLLQVFLVGRYVWLRRLRLLRDRPNGASSSFVAPKANVVIVRTGSDFGINIVQWSQVFQYIATP